MEDKNNSAGSEEQTQTEDAESIQTDVESVEEVNKIAASENTAEKTDGDEKLNGEVEEEAPQNATDMIAESISAEASVSRVLRVFKIPKKIAVYIVAAAYFVVGALCVSITNYITHYLSYIVGSMMTVFGLIGLIFSIIQREYKSTKTNRTATDLIMFDVGIMVLFEEIDPDSDPITMISIVWGIFGLFEGAHAFNHAFSRIANSQRCVYFLLKGIVECAVGFIMLYRPNSHEAHFLHIVVFGISLMVDAITMIPKVKDALTKF